MFYSVFFKSNYGIKIYIFNAFKNIAFNLRIDFAHLLKRHNKFPFEVVYLVMDPGYSPENREIIEKNAKLLNVPITIFESNIFESVLHVEKSPCYLCARMRRGHLYNKAKELGCAF